ncbi:hypothetical protein [Bradyrhizobium sp. RDM4]|uniref:hypothetical protein n=1 Tax=Bradyrhizobium sp. RDM4 TaxID=3378765 RepID=UPI0038FD305F
MQQQDTRKNYIGIVSDTTEDERISNATVRAQPHMVSDLVRRIAAALGRSRKRAPEPAGTR